MVGSTRLHLRDWWVRDLENDPFIPPECRHKIICGKVFDKPGFDDGSVICTSIIEDAKGRFVLTSSGSVYRLHGRPDKDYVKWMKEKGIIYDGYAPIKIKS